jgi:hypothetical protein
VTTGELNLKIARKTWQKEKEMGRSELEMIGVFFLMLVVTIIGFGAYDWYISRYDVPDLHQTASLVRENILLTKDGLEKLDSPLETRVSEDLDGIYKTNDKGWVRFVRVEKIYPVEYCTGKEALVNNEVYRVGKVVKATPLADTWMAFTNLIGQPIKSAKIVGNKALITVTTYTF